MPPTDEKTKKQDLAEVNRAVMALRRRFDTVQIFVTRHEGSRGTVHNATGSGDIFARYGITEQWLQQQKFDRVHDYAEPPEDDENAE